MNICIVDGCGRKRFGHGYCQKHYMHIRTHGQIMPDRGTKKCSSSGCGSKHYSKGYCIRHYVQMKKHGKIIRTARDGNEIINKKNHAEIILYDRHGNEKEITFIDLEDVSKCRHERWSLTNHGYVICTIKHNGKSYLRLQNLIMNHKQSRKTVIDHKDGDKLNNRKSNLRIAKTWQNNVNRNFNIKNKVSKYRGVSPAKYEKKPWTASIKADGIRYFLGYYYTEIEAAQAYDVAAKKHHKEFAVLNEV